MSRNFGVTGSTAIEGANQPSSPHYAQDTPRGSNLLSGSPALKRSQLTQATLDILAVLGCFLFLSVTAIGLVFSLYVLWFVKV